MATAEILHVSIHDSVVELVLLSLSPFGIEVVAVTVCYL